MSFILRLLLQHCQGAALPLNQEAVKKRSGETVHDGEREHWVGGISKQKKIIIYTCVVKEGGSVAVVVVLVVVVVPDRRCSQTLENDAERAAASPLRAKQVSPPGPSQTLITSL